MNISDYIESGILEGYLLGTVSEQERQEVECLSKIYPEIQEALNLLQDGIENMSRLYSVDPSEHVKSNILAAIEHIEQDNSAVQEQTPVRSISQANNNGFGFWKVAAVVAILIASASGFMYFNASGELSELSNDFGEYKQRTEEQKQRFGQQVAALELKVSNKVLELEMIKDPATMRIKMTGTPGHDDMEAVVYCDMKTDMVYMSANNFPDPPADMGYQLWAIIDGEPVALGMVDLTMTADSLQEMTIAKNVDAFAVTLEVAEGVNTPTEDQMIALGSV